MPLVFNSKEIKNPILKFITIVGVLLFTGLLLTIILPIVGIVLAIVIAAVVIAVPLIIIVLKYGIGKVTKQVNVNINYDEESMEKHVGPVLERRGVDKDISIATKHCDLDIQGVDQDSLVIESEDGMIFIKESEEKLQLLLKEDAKIMLPTKSDIKVFTGAGDVKIYHMNSVEVASGAGDVSVRELGRRAKIATAAGDVSISFKQNAEEGKVSIATASGDASISLPETATVNYKKRVMIGKLKSVFKSSEDGRFEVKFASASGDLSISEIKSLN